MPKRRGDRASAKKTAARTVRKAAARRGPVVGTRGGGQPRPAEGDGVDEQLVERTVALLMAHDAAVGPRSGGSGRTSSMSISEETRRWRGRGTRGSR